ncbi:MAG TPA: DUF3168 domain-containing protein [Anaerolineae bacterium]|nr:DUF3168 domain-containing protein [Anaerolineae bacterium]
MKAIRAAIYSQLISDTALISELGGATAVYYSVAPQGTALPVVIFFNAGGGPENQYPGDLTTERYLIKGVSNTLDEALDIDGAIQAAMHKQTLTVAGFTNIWTRRTGDVSLTENSDDGSLIRHEGAYYRIRVDA